MRRKLKKAAAAWFLFCSACFIDSKGGRAALASVNMHSVWSLMGWREFNQLFVHTWVPQLCGRLSSFPLFPQFSCERQAGDTNLLQTLLYSVYFPRHSFFFFLVDDNNVDLYVAADPGALSCFLFLRFRTEMQQRWRQREPA